MLNTYICDMKNNEIIKRLKSEGFEISHATFYRYKKKGLIDSDMSLTEIRKILRKIAKQKAKTINDLVK